MLTKSTKSTINYFYQYMSLETPESKIEDGGRFSKYIYRDNSVGGEVIFECVAKDILEADKMYQEKTGKNPEKQTYIGCSIEKIKPGA